MRELLFFPENLAQPLKWATYSPDGALVFSEPVKAEALSDYKQQKRKAVTIILPGQQASTYRFAMPKISGAAKQQAIAYAIEGLCSQSLEDVYVVAGDYIDGQQSALVIDKAYLDGVLQMAKEQHLIVQNIHIDYMLLKKPELASWTVTQIKQDILWRTDQGTGGRIEQSLWPIILQQVFVDKKHVPKEFIWTLWDDKKPSALPEQLEKMVTEIFLEVPSWIDPQSLSSPALYQLNIGPNKLRTIFNKRKKTLWKTSQLLVAVVVLAIISQAAFTLFIQIKLNKETAILHKILMPLGMGNMPLSAIKQRLKHSIEQIEKVQALDGFTYSVSDISQFIPAANKNDLLSMIYDQKSGLKLEFPKDKMAAVVQALKIAMPTYNISIQEDNKKQQASTGWISIKKVVA